MEINGKNIANKILEQLRDEVKKQGLTPKLVVFSINPSESDQIYIKLKREAAALIGAGFEVVYFRKTPRFEDFANILRTKADSAETSGLIIQRPLPSQLSTETVFNYVPTIKEIEGHKAKSPFLPPLGLGVLTMIKYIFDPASKENPDNLSVDIKKDMSFFKNVLRRKKIVLMGRGETGGKPIGKILSALRINYINTHSKTSAESEFYADADIIITATGKKVVTPEMIKPGVILLNVGFRREAGLSKGDYDMDEIKDIASFYTPTPNGIGPLEIAYLMSNLVESAKLQKAKFSS